MKGQLELDIERNHERDRNFHLGGRSFYFFDFDDNIAHLTTPLIVFHKKTLDEKLLSSEEWAKYNSVIGKPGIYEDYFIDFDERNGSFRYFRDHSFEDLKRRGLNNQYFVEDVAKALSIGHMEWRGPSWECFYHATFNRRPISIITARGHEPETIKEGIRCFVDSGYLPHEPNYLSLFPVSRPRTRLDLGDGDLTQSSAELKQKAIRASVLRAFEVYGYSPHHRFGMSDDDPRNIQLIWEEMKRLKLEFPEVSFFLIETDNQQFKKHEVLLAETSTEVVKDPVQLSLDLG